MRQRGGPTEEGGYAQWQWANDKGDVCPMGTDSVFQEMLHVWILWYYFMIFGYKSQ